MNQPLPAEQASAAEGPAAGAGRPTGRRVAIQLIGFALSLGLLYWCVSLAFGDAAMRQKLPRLLETPVWLIACLLVLSALTVSISGLVFWAVLRPVRALRAADLVAVNAVCTLLGYLPMKISLLFRVLVHSRRDKVPLLTMSAWFGAVAVIILTSLAGPIGASLWRGGLDAAWWAISAGVLVTGGVLMVVVCRALNGPRGRAMALKVAGGLRPAALRRFALSPSAARLVGGVVMLADPRAVSLALVLRCADILAQSTRFYLAAQAAAGAGLVQTPLSIEHSVLAGALYFLLQVLAPTGVAGVREGGTVGLLAMLPGWMANQQFAAVVLVVSMTEAVANVLLGAAGAVWLRVGKRLTEAGRPDPAAP